MKRGGNRYKHGFAPLVGKRKSVYQIWNGMNSRCTNANDKRFKDYGGRGIRVCDRWRGEHGFQNFLSDMGEPLSGMSIERIDNDKGYSPENCRWIPKPDQAKNRKYNWKVIFDGQQMTAKEANAKLGLARHTIAQRLRKLKRSKDVPVPIEELLLRRSSSFKGVTFVKSRNKWQAQTYVSGKKLMIGRYTNEIAAANAYREFWMQRDL